MGRANLERVEGVPYKIGHDSAIVVRPALIDLRLLLLHENEVLDCRDSVGLR